MSLLDIQVPASSRRPRLAPFRVSKTEIWPGCLEIEIEGELDRAVSDRLRSVLEQAAADRRHVLLGFAGCDFIDAAGLAVLVCSQEGLRDRGRQLLLYGVHGQVRRMLLKTGLTENGLPIAPVKEGTQALGRLPAFESLNGSRNRRVGRIAHR